MKKIEEKYIKRELDVKPGDTVKVHLRITEAGKERVQIFEGVVIGIKGSGLGRSITVRKISKGVGVEKILPVNSPIVKKIDIVERGKVRRAKLYYMRNRVGKRSLDVGSESGFEAIMEEEKVPEEEKKTLKKEEVREKAESEGRQFEEKATKKGKKSEKKEVKKDAKAEKPEKKEEKKKEEKPEKKAEKSTKKESE